MRVRGDPFSPFGLAPAIGFVLVAIGLVAYGIASLLGWSP
jgi:hypothetical protein